MSARRVFAALASAALRRPLLVVLLALALGAAGAALAVGLAPSTALNSFVEDSSPTYRATQSFYRRFGQEPIEIVVKGNLQRLLLSEDIVRLLGLEGCLAGRAGAPELQAAGGRGGPCGQLARTRPAKVVIGPATFINEAALEIDEALESREHAAARRAANAEAAVQQRALEHGYSTATASALGRQAKQVVMRSFEAEVATLAIRYGLSKPPSLSEREFVTTLVFDNATRLPGTPKQRFAYLFPSREAALISVRLRPGLSQHATEAAIATIRRAVAMPQWRLRYGERYLITGEPVILSELSGSIAHSILLLLIGAMLAMALMLGLVFRGTPKLLPLAIALLTSALTFGGLAVSGAKLSVGDVAVLPVLIGLAVDYAIQLQSRIEEAMRDGGLDLRSAVVAAARSGGPPIAAAAAASCGAMLVLELSPVPTVRSFALLLVIGLAIALLCAVTVGSAAVVLAAGRPRRGLGGGELGAAWRGAQQLVRENALLDAMAQVALRRVPGRPWLTLAVGAACAALGWGLSGLTPVQTDITKLVPQSMPSLRNLATLEKLSGVGGELDLLISGRNVTKPATIEWMRSYQSLMLAKFGYSKSKGCGKAPLCPALSLPDLLSGPEGAAGAGGASAGAASAGAAGAGGAGTSGAGTGGTGTSGAASASGAGKAPRLSAAELNSFLRTVPPYFSEEVISADRRDATLAFGLKLMPLSAQQHMIEEMRAALHPPTGVHASLVGLPVLAAAADAEVASTGRRSLQLLLGLFAVTLVLLAAFRGDLRRALVPVVPVLLASGWSALVLLIVGVPLNPMSVTLGALVIAVSTEFSVLLAERYRAERLTGHSNEAALERAYRATGAAVAASAVTAIAGFGVLVLSDIAMLRDFGFVTLIDLTVSLLGVLLVLPASLTLAYGEQARSTARRFALPAPWRRSQTHDGISA